jgi:hypothetical protein
MADGLVLEPGEVDRLLHGRGEEEEAGKDWHAAEDAVRDAGTEWVGVAGRRVSGGREPRWHGAKRQAYQPALIPNLA